MSKANNYEIELKKVLIYDYKRYSNLLKIENSKIMRHYYQGKLDYISQLSAILNLDILNYEV